MNKKIRLLAVALTAVTALSFGSCNVKTKIERRVVSMGNDKNNMAVRRISSLYDENGRKKKNLIPIEKYPDILKPSGVEVKSFRKTVGGKPIQEKFLTKTKTRFNKWDMKKISTSYKCKK